MLGYRTMDAQKQSEIIVSKSKKSSELNDTALEGELIDANVIVKLEDKKDDRDKSYILDLFNVFKISAEVKDLVNPNKEYFVKFPAELAKKMKEHNLDFLRDSITGDILPVLYDYTEKGIAGQIRLELRDNVSPKQLEHFGDSVSHMIEQARFNSLAEQLVQIQYDVQRIQQGQDSDRYAEVLTGIELLDDAKNSSNETNRIDLAHSAIKSLREGTNKIKFALLSELDKLPKINDTIRARIWFTISDPENRSKLRTTYNQVQIYFENYYKGLVPLTEAYSLIGEPQIIEALVESTVEVLHHKNLYRLNTMEKLLPIGYDYSINWYKHPSRIEQKMRDAYSLEHVAEEKLFKISGQEILMLQEEKIHDKAKRKE